MKKGNTILNNLIETLKDGQEGFKQAAESERREVNPAAFLFTSKRASKGEIILLCQKKNQSN